MKKILLLTVAALSLTQSAMAQLTDDGFYRVQNYTTNRYISIIDNKSYTQTMTTTPDLLALQTMLTLDKVLTDPSTVFYINKVSYDATYSADVCNIQGQGTDMYEIIRHYLYVKDQTYGKGQKYRAFAIESGTHFLGDNTGTSDEGMLNVNKENRDWRIIPFGADTDNYFGVKPTVIADGRYFASLYCGFSYSHYSTGVKSYVVDRIWEGNAVIREIEGIVPMKTPVIIECSTSDFSKNRLDFTKDNGTNVGTNLLKGAMFNIYYKSHNNRVLNDPNTMRVLGVCSNGKPGFVKKTTSQLLAMPANTAYLVVPQGTEDELPLMYYEDFVAAGIDGVTMNGTSVSDVRTLSGVTVRKNATTTEGLPSGVYIWNKKKITVK